MKNIVLCLFILGSCQQKSKLQQAREFSIVNAGFKGYARVENLSYSSGFRILLKNSSHQIIDQLIFKHTFYQLDTADVDRDGRTELLIGLIKRTQFDPKEKKRLFILRIDEGQLRPLWLGSRVCRQLVDFQTRENGTVRTLERTTSDNYAIGKYYWQSFGLTLQEYTHNEISFDEAISIFKSTE